MKDFTDKYGGAIEKAFFAGCVAAAAVAPVLFTIAIYSRLKAAV